MKKSFITVALALFVSFFITFTFACSTTVEEPASEEAKTEQQEEKKTESPASNGGTSGGTSQGGGSNPAGGQNGGGQTPLTPESGTPQPPAPIVNYTVTFMSNCETATGTTNSITAAENTNITLTANGFVREGYTFTGWNTSADGTGTGYAESSTIKLTGNLILYAQWILATVPTYSVAINEVEHGTVAVSQAVAEAGTQISITVTPDELYAFNTINLTAADETVITPVVDSENANQYTFTMPEQNVTLSVSFVYIAHSITVSSVENGTVTVNKTAAVAGSEVSIILTPNTDYLLDTISITQTDGSVIPVTLNAMNTNVYTFTMPDSAIVINVLFKIKTYTVSFVTNCSEEIPSQIIEKGGKATSPRYPKSSEVHQYYVQQDWYTDINCKNRFNFNSEINSDITLYAKWDVFNVTKNTIIERIKTLPYSCEIKCRDTGVLSNADGTYTVITYDANEIREINKALKDLYARNNEILVKLDLYISSLESASSTEPYNAFYGCKNLSYLYIHNIQTIGDYAFANCSNLGAIITGSMIMQDMNGQQIFSGVTYIGDSICSGCEKLTEFTDGSGTENILPKTLTHIGDSAFKNCSKLKDIVIDNAATNIGDYAFAGCTSMKSISLGDNITEIGAYAFSNCTGITEITVPDSVTAIGEAAFNGCSSLKEMTIPFIGEYAEGPEPSSYGIGNERTLFGYIFGSEIYDGGYRIGQIYNTRWECAIYYIPKSLRKVTVTGGQLYYGSFNSCEKIKQIILEDGVSTISKKDGVAKIFDGCRSLESCRLPGGIQELGDAFFTGCASLSSVEIPASVTNIHSKAFTNCTILNEAVFRDTTSSWKKGDEDIGPMSSIDTYANAQLLKSIVDEKVNLKKITN